MSDSLFVKEMRKRFGLISRILVNMWIIFIKMENLPWKQLTRISC